MRMRAALCALVLGTVSAAADVRPRAEYRWTPRAVTADADIPSVPGFSNIIYLNRCADGCMLYVGDDDATTDTSSIPGQTSIVQPFDAGDAVWNQVVDCVRLSYAPFNVQIVTTRPPAGTNYHMAIIAGRPGDVEMQSGVGGVSPFSCGYIPNSISFTFSNVYGGDVQQMCWTVAQETAHSWGLDHKFDNRDPMTYLDAGPIHKDYQNQPGACGEYNARQCMCTYPDTGKAQMNSYARVMATFGSSVPDTMPPAVHITSPADGAQVTGTLSMSADATDDVAIAKVEFRVDGTMLGSTTSAPYVWSGSPLAQGAHVVKVTAYDPMGNTADAQITVLNGKACKKPSDCPDTDTCVDGRCVAAGDHGLGATCAANSDCASSQCAQDSSGNEYCVEICDPSKHGCPSGFGCIQAGTSSVCWPGADDGGGCNTDSSGAPLVLGFALIGTAITLRRRR